MSDIDTVPLPPSVLVVISDKPPLRILLRHIITDSLIEKYKLPTRDLLKCKY